MPAPCYEFIGRGVYSLADASRLTGIPVPRIGRWVKGYSYRYRGETQRSSAVVGADYSPLDGAVALSFLDLIEVRFVDAFRKHGVGWKTIREAARRAESLLEEKHPFATRSFQTDGRSIFMTIANELGERRLLDLVRSQYAFRQVIEPSLFRGIEFDDQVAARWRPLCRLPVVVDPRRAFGQPVVDVEGVPTSVLAEAFRIEQSTSRVSDWYGVSRASATAGVEFEKSLSG